MSITLDISDALRRERATLSRGFIPPVSTAQMQAILRIEASMDTLDALHEEECRFRQGFIDAASRWDEPHTFLGVTLYVVPYPLPAPGWRVINPMVAK